MVGVKLMEKGFYNPGRGYWQVVGGAKMTVEMCGESLFAIWWCR